MSDRKMARNAPPLHAAALAVTVLLACGGDATDMVCGSGTHLDGDQCVPDLVGAALCGEGTHLAGEVCLPDVGPAAFCGPGTIVTGAVCVPSGDPTPWCGPGTIRSGAVCVPDGDPSAWCGPGTRAVDGRCTYDGDASGFCGPGTAMTAGLCVPSTPAAAYCGAGTTLAGGICVPSLDPASLCGPGTILVGAVCLPSAAPADYCGPGTVLDGSLCVASTDPARWCGPGTSLVSGVCVPSTSPALFCGPGTALSGGLCLPTANPAGWCGAGTVYDGALCVPARSAAEWCGAGTVLADGVCVPARTPADYCGTGTHLDGDRCVPDADPTPWCGPGTVASGGVCVPAAPGVWQVRLGATQAFADGYTRVPVLVIGPYGGATTTAVLGLSRAGAGHLEDASVEVGAIGATTYLVPCSSTSPSCAGPVRVLAFLPGDLANPVATSDELELVARPAFGDPSPCLAAPNSLHLDGSGWIFTGVKTIVDGTFTAGHTLPYDVLFHYSGSSGYFDIRMDTTMLRVPIEEQVYVGALYWRPQQFGHPGFDISGNGAACGYPKSTFHVQRLFDTNFVLSELLVTFEQVCDLETIPLRGCLHYTAPPPP